jgi:Rrf2 family protein
VTTLTRKCQYALRALYFLAREYGKGPILIPQIAACVNAPVAFLQGVLCELKNAGILGSRRGSQGGYYLRIPPNQVTVGSIVRMIDGPLVTIPCVGETHPCADCRDPEACQTRLLMRDVHEVLTGILDRATLMPDSESAPGSPWWNSREAAQARFGSRAKREEEVDAGHPPRRRSSPASGRRSQRGRREFHHGLPGHESCRWHDRENAIEDAGHY